LTEDDHKEIQREVRATVKASMDWAENSPTPPSSDLYRDVYRERWGPYTGTSEPEMLGGAEIECKFNAIDTTIDRKADLL